MKLFPQILHLWWSKYLLSWTRLDSCLFSTRKAEHLMSPSLFYPEFLRWDASMRWGFLKSMFGVDTNPHKRQVEMTCSRLLWFRLLCRCKLEMNQNLCPHKLYQGWCFSSCVCWDCSIILMLFYRRCNYEDILHLIVYNSGWFSLLMLWIYVL